MGDNRRSVGGNCGGSYLVMQQMKDTYHHVGRPSPPNSRQASAHFGSPTSQHLLSEIQRLQVANAKLNAKLAFAANRVPGLNKVLGVKESMDGGLFGGGSGPLARREDSATTAAGRAPRSSTDAGGSGVGAELILDDLLLNEEEVQEAAMRCSWLARYWTLAEQLGICDDIAHEKAAYWRALALPLSSYFECAKAAVMPFVTVQPGPKEANRCLTEGSVSSPQGGILVPSAQGDPRASNELPLPVPGGGGATVADVVELERALRQLSELGVVQEVLASLMHQRQAAFSAQLQASVESYDADEASIALPKLQATPSTISNTAVAGSVQMGSTQMGSSLAVEGGVQAEEGGPGSSSGGEGMEVSASEAQEVAFQRAWLAYIWSRAASLGVEPHINKERAEHWGHLLLWGSAGPPAPPNPPESVFAAGVQSQAATSLGGAGGAGPAMPPGGGPVAMAHAKDLMGVHAGLQELARLGVEQQIWACRARL